MAKRRKMDNVITSIGFDSKSKRNKKADSSVITLINEFAILNPGIPVKSLIRNHLLTTLQESIDLARQIKRAKTA